MSGTEIFIEKRKRGFFGWLFLLIFLIWNAAMAGWLISYFVVAGPLVDSASSDAERIGSTIGIGIATSAILVIWGFGAVITGLFALLFRGSKTIVRRSDRQAPEPRLEA